MHRVFQWRRLQRLVVPQERYGERCEPALKRKRLSQQRKESEPLGAPTRRSPSIVSRSGSVSLRSERRFLLRGGSFSLSNSVQCSVKPRNDRRHKPGDARKLEEDTAIIQTLKKHGSERSSTRTVHGKRRTLRLRCQEMTPNHLATGYKSIRTCLIGMLRFMDTPPSGAMCPRVSCP